MSRTTAPLLSFGASGQIAKTQVYASWKGRPYARRYAIPANPNTTAQQETRNTFKFLNNVWKYMPSTATEAWLLYANNSRITDRNAFQKINLSPLRSQADLTNFIFSPAAGSGIAAASIAVAPGVASLAVTITEPTLPAGWTITQAIAACIRDQDPQTGLLYVVTAGVDVATPFVITLTGLTSGQLYQVGGWIQYLKPDGTPAFGQSLQTTGTPT